MITITRLLLGLDTTPGSGYLCAVGAKSSGLKPSGQVIMDLVGSVSLCMGMEGSHLPPWEMGVDNIAGSLLPFHCVWGTSVLPKV